MKRPVVGGNYVTTPGVGAVIELLGSGPSYGGVSLSRDEFHDLNRLYEVHPEWDPLLQAGANNNVLRHAVADGLRLLAWLSKYVDRGQDPLKTLVIMACDAGFDVHPEDHDWAAED